MPAARAAAAAAAHAGSPAPPISLGEMAIERGSEFQVYLHRDESADPPAASHSATNCAPGALRGP